MIDDQIAVGPRFRICQGVGDAADRLVGGRPDQGRILVEHDVETELRQFRQLGRDRRPLLRLGIRSCLDPVGSLLASRQPVDIRLGFNGKFLDDVCRSTSPFAPAPPPSARQTGPGREARDRCRAAFFPKHQRYPAALIALLQFGVAFLVDSKRHCRPLTGSCRTSPHSWFNSQLHSFTREVRAVMRCWMAPRAWG